MKQRVRTTLQLVVALALILSLLPLTAIAQQSISEKADIVDTAIAAGDFNTLVELVQAAGLVDVLKGEGPYTVFAPTDAAFAAVPADVLAALAADTEALKSVLLYHVLEGRVIAALISDGRVATTAEGSDVTFSFADGVKAINGAKIVARDIQASNGVIHVIDSVILPPAIAAVLGGGAEAASAAAAEEVAEEAATEEAAEEAAAEETPVATEETPVATEEAAEEAAAEETPVATEEAAEEAAAEETPVATEEAAEEAAAEETPVATEEAAEEAAAEETPVATEEAAEEAAAEATPVPTEEAVAEEAAEELPAPDTLPVTGGADNGIIGLLIGLAMVVFAGLALTMRRRLA